MTKTALNRIGNFFSFDLNPIVTNDILNIHKCLKK